MILPQHLEKLREVLAEIEHDETLRDPARYVDRAEALEFLEFEYFGGLADETSEEAVALRDRAHAVYEALNRIDRALLSELHARILDRTFDRRELHRRLRRICDESAARAPEAFYGHADFLVNELLGFSAEGLAQVADEVERRSKLPPDPERVFYQATPVRQVLGFIERARIGPEDVVFDLGAGIGKVAMLVNLLTGARTVGIEIEPAYAAHGRARIEALGLGGVELRTEDAQSADFAEATAYFLYHPFTGALLDRVLQRLSAEAGKRPLRIGTLGRCTFEFARQSWLRGIDDEALDEHQVGVFRSPWA